MNKNDIGYGKKRWVFAAGHIPLLSTGKEPAFTSHDKIAILNTSGRDARIGLQIFYEDTDPVVDHKISVKARRVRKIRFNDLIDPLPIPLGTPFGFILTSDTEVIVQFSRMDTGYKEVAIFCSTLAFQGNR